MNDVFFWADSRRRIREFPHLMIKPNQFEAVGMDNPIPGDEVAPDALREAAQQLRERNQAPVLITRGEQGMIVSDPEWTLVPGVAVDGEIDPTGAGDSATAGTVLALCAGAELPEAALVGNLVASITIEQIATTGVARPDQLPERLAMWLQQQQA
jgi:sugar/nucleoside kinase (ribokinase family)